MKKVRVLKYLILICGITMSFFMFVRGKVSALDYSINDGKIVLNLEPVVVEEKTTGYIIDGATTTCAEGDSSCVVDWEIPATYTDGKPIIGIEDCSDASANSAGVLENISEVVSGTVTISDNLQEIGKCAFCNFSNVTEYILGESVSLIDEYAFSNNGLLKVITITAYNSAKTEIVSPNAFYLSANLNKIAFKNSTIASIYKNNVNGWSAVSIPFTYRITYRFYDENQQNIMDSIIVFENETLGEIPDDPSNGKTGFDFKWVSAKSSSIQITSSSTGMDIEKYENGIPVYDVVPVWTLKEANIKIQTSFNGDVKEHLDNGNISVIYGGKNSPLNIKALVSHDLEITEEPTEGKLVATYLWDSNIKGIPNPGFSSLSNFDISRVAHSGNYKCTVTVSYYISDNGELVVSQTVVKTIEIDASITPRDLIISLNVVETEYGISVEAIEDNEGSFYKVDESTSLAPGEMIKSFSFLGYSNEVPVGTYVGVLKGSVVSIGYEGETGNYIRDYNISYVNGDLVVNKRQVVGGLEEDMIVEYGKSASLLDNKTIDMYGVSTEIVIQYIRDDIGNMNAGSYSLKSANVLKNGVIDTNYSVSLSEELTGKIRIVPKKVDVEWILDENMVYSGIEKTITASYKNINNVSINLSVSIIKDSIPSSLINAGAYSVVASKANVDNNYELVGFEREIEIEKADSVFIGAQRQVTTYNGLPQRVEVALNHSEGTIVYGDYSLCKNAAMTSSETCAISVSAAETENYKAISGNFYLHIDPYELEVQPDLFEFNYGTVIGQYNLNNTYDGVNGEKVIVYFAKEGSATDLDVGYYNIVSAYLTNNTNYKVIMTNNTGANKIKINPSPIEIRFYFYEGLVYDGAVKNIGIRYFGTTEDVGLEIDYGDKNIIKNAGDYRIDVSITNENFYIEGNDYLEFSIAKASYDISGVKLNSVKTKFNFKNHFINLEGDLPKGLIAIYTIDGKSGNGTYLPFKHTVKVSFEGDYENYHYVPSMEAVLNVDMSWVFITIGLTLLFGVGVPLTFILLIKFEIIKIRKRVKRRVIWRMIRKNRELDRLNNMFIENRKALSKEDEIEEGALIEEPVKFVKKPVNTEPEELIALSFVDELFRCSYGTKQFYSEVKNEFLSYEGIVSKIKRDYETFYLKNVPIAKLDVVDGKLYVYFALDPKQYKTEEYNHENASKEKEFSSVPLKLLVDSIESLRHAKMFVRIIRKREGIKAVSNFIRTDYVSVYTAKDNSFKLFKKVFVKKGSKEALED